MLMQGAKTPNPVGFVAALRDALENALAQHSLLLMFQSDELLL